MSEQEYDVVVVGMGVAGLSAAVSAAAAGARVAIVERAVEGEHGGNTRYTEAFLRMKSLDEVSDDFEDNLAAESGYHLDPGLIAETGWDADKRSSIVRAGNFLDPDVIVTLSSEASPTLRWLEEQGVRFAPADTPFLTASAPRLAPVGGGLAIVEVLTGRARELGVHINFESSARKLLTSDGRIVGVRTWSRGDLVDLHAASVILASGGFEGSAEMLSRYIGLGNFARPVARGGYYNRGEGIQMALEVGAATCGDFTLFHAEPIDPRSGQAEAAVFGFGYGILVNALGNRFVDEATGTSDATYEAVTRKILEQPKGVAFAIFDSRLSDVPNYQTAFRTDQKPITADSVSALAELLEVPASALEATIESFNAACREGDFLPLELDGLATDGVHPSKSNWARPIVVEPYLAYPVMAANVFTFGGLKVDTEARVLDADGQVIDGLYAAGEAMGFYYGRYTGSTSVLRGAVFGRIAGEHAASRQPATAEGRVA